MRSVNMECTSPSTSLVKCCDCGCSCSYMNRSYSGTWMRSVKRKIDESEVESNGFVVSRFGHPDVAFIQIENECEALREMVANQQQTIQDLCSDLEEERNASSSAANEAMSMILRLQREKAEVQMEARQFKRFAEEKMAHDQEEQMAFEDLLYKREQIIQSLTCEVQAYKHRLMSYGLTEFEAEGGKGVMSRNTSMTDHDESPTFEYPPLKCNFIHAGAENEGEDVEKYAFAETPHSWRDLEHHINQLEKSPRHIYPDGEFVGTKNVLEKVIVGHSPRMSRHLRKFSTDSAGSFYAMGKELGPDLATDSPGFDGSVRKECAQVEDYSNLKKVDNVSDVGDDMTDRVYTIDSVCNGVPYNGVTNPKATTGIGDEYMSTPRDSMNFADFGDADVRKLYMRLQALEADRESMRQAIINVRTDKAQLVLLKEIAQHLCKDMTPVTRLPVKRPPAAGIFSFMTIFKWIASIVFRRKKAKRSKYMFGLSTDNQGLLMLLDKGPLPRVGQWRCFSRTQM